MHQLFDSEYLTAEYDPRARYDLSAPDYSDAGPEELPELSQLLFALS